MGSGIDVVPDRSAAELRGAALQICIDDTCSTTESLPGVDQGNVPFREPFQSGIGVQASATAHVDRLRNGDGIVLASIQPNPGLPPSIELRVRLVSAWGEVWGEHERTVNLAYDACSGTRGGHAVIYPESPSQLSCGSQTCPGVNLTFALPEGIDGAKLCRGAQCTGFMRRGSLGPEGHLDGMSCDVEGPPARLFCRERPGRIPATEIYEVALYRGESLVAELGVPVTYDQLYPNEGGCDARPCRTATLDLGDVEVMR